VREIARDRKPADGHLISRLPACRDPSFQRKCNPERSLFSAGGCAEDPEPALGRRPHRPFPDGVLPGQELHLSRRPGSAEKRTRSYRLGEDRVKPGSRSGRSQGFGPFATPSGFMFWMRRKGSAWWKLFSTALIKQILNFQFSIRKGHWNRRPFHPSLCPGPPHGLRARGGQEPPQQPFQWRSLYGRP